MCCRSRGDSTVRVTGAGESTAGPESGTETGRAEAAGSLGVVMRGRMRGRASAAGDRRRGEFSSVRRAWAEDGGLGDRPTLGASGM